MSSTHFDVLITGGGLFGSFTAYHLLSREPGLRVAVLERDPAFERAASVHSMAGVRVLFSQPESIWMSQYGHEVYGAYPELMAVDDEPGELHLRRHGYLIMAVTEQESADMRLNHEVQTAQGCDVQLHDADSLKRLRPSLFTDDVRLAVYAPGDMTVDPYGALMGLRRKIRAMGAAFETGEAAGIEWSGQRVSAVTTDDGRRLTADWFINTTGAWAPRTLAPLDIRLPVQPSPKMICFFECQSDLSADDFGVTIDGPRAGFRPTGTGFTSVLDQPDRLGEFVWEPDAARFETDKWPALAHRVPAFEAIKLRTVTACHYAQNTFDGNLLLGAWPGRPENFLLATGASGHGFQHAPAAGRALSELVLDGRYTTLDLTRFGCRRVVENRPDPERGFVA